GRHIRRPGPGRGHPRPPAASLDHGQHSWPQLSSTGETQGRHFHRVAYAGKGGLTSQNNWSGEFYLAIIGEFLVAVDITSYPLHIRLWRMSSIRVDLPAP